MPETDNSPDREEDNVIKESDNFIQKTLKLEFEEKKLIKRRRELEDQFLHENKIDKLMFDPEYMGIEERIEEIKKLKIINDQTSRMEKDISDFRKRLKNEVERMLKEQ